MLKRIRFLLLVLLPAGIVAGLLLCTRPESQPTWRGTTLEQWMLLNHGGDDRGAEAIRTIGTNAIPCLLKWISYRSPSVWARHFGNDAKIEGQLLSELPKLRGWLSRPIERNELRAEMAIEAFRLLGTNAISAAPMLQSIAQAGNRFTESSWRASSALSALTSEEERKLFALEVLRCAYEQQLLWTNEPAH